MKKEKKKSVGAVTVLLYIAAAAFLAYGIYMVNNSLNYVRYYGPDGVSTESAVQYIVTSSITYFGFAVVILAAAHITRLLRKIMYSRPAAAEAPEKIPAPDAEEEVIEAPVPGQLSFINAVPDEAPETDDIEIDMPEPAVPEPEPEPVKIMERPSRPRPVKEPEPVIAEEKPAVPGPAIADEEPPRPPLRKVETEVIKEVPEDEPADHHEDKISSTMIRDIFERR